jgi:hypothetical protein
MRERLKVILSNLLSSTSTQPSRFAVLGNFLNFPRFLIESNGIKIAALDQEGEQIGESVWPISINPSQ